MQPLSELMKVSLRVCVPMLSGPSTGTRSTTDTVTGSCCTGTETVTCTPTPSSNRWTATAGAGRGRPGQASGTLNSSPTGEVRGTGVSEVGPAQSITSWAEPLLCTIITTPQWIEVHFCDRKQAIVKFFSLWCHYVSCHVWALPSVFVNQSIFSLQASLIRINICPLNYAEPYWLHMVMPLSLLVPQYRWIIRMRNLFSLVIPSF